MSVNPFKRLLDLMPQPPLLVGDVTAINGSIVTITLPGGGVMQARGPATVGTRVFFRDDVIEGTAPTLPIELIDV